MSVELSHTEVTAMADAADETSGLVNGTVSAHEGDTTAAATGISGWQTAAALTGVMEQWSQKANACQQSLSYFGAALRSTATAIAGTDANNSAQIDLVVPDGNPILDAQPPWLNPDGTGV